MMTLGVTCHHNDRHDQWTAGCAVFDGPQLLAARLEYADTPVNSLADLPGLSQCLEDAGVRTTQIQSLAIADPAWPLPEAPPAWPTLLQHPVIAWRDWRHSATARHAQAELLRALSAQGFDTPQLQVTRVNTALARAVGSWQWLCGDRPARVLCLIDVDNILTTGTVLDADAADINLLERKTWPEAPLTALRIVADFLGMNLDRDASTWHDVCAAGQADHYQLDRLFSSPTGLLNQLYLKPDHWQAYRRNGQDRAFSQQLVDWLGEPPVAEPTRLPYPHYGAAVQRMVEDALLHQLDVALALSDHQQPLVLASHHLHCLPDHGLALQSRMARRFAHLPCRMDPFPARAGDALHAAIYHQWQQGLRGFTAVDSSALAGFGTHTPASDC